MKPEGSLILAILNLLGVSSTAPAPPSFLLDATAFEGRANMTSGGGTVTVLSAPSGHSSVNLLSSGNLTLSNLNIASGGMIYIKGNLDIFGSITMAAGKELFLMVDGNVKIDAPIISSLAANYNNIHIIATNKVEVRRPVNWTGTIRSNDEIKFKAKSTLSYVAPSMTPPGVATTG